MIGHSSEGHGTFVARLRQFPHRWHVLCFIPEEMDEGGASAAVDGRRLLGATRHRQDTDTVTDTDTVSFE